VAIQLNPTINDPFETKTLAQLAQLVLYGLGFTRPQLYTSRTLLDLRTDIKTRLGLATPLAVVTDTLLNIRTDLYNMLGFAAMATHPPGVDTMLNAFINQAQQFLHRALELDRGGQTAPPVLSADGSVCVLDRDAILRIALGNAKAKYRQADSQIYLGEAQKYVADLKGRTPPNIDALVNASLQDAQRVIARRYETAFAVDGGTIGIASFSADTDSTTLDPEAIFLLALANLKDSFKQEDAKEIRAQFEHLMADMVHRQPPNAPTTVRRLIKDAQQYLYRLYPVFRMERWFTWTTVAGQRFYSVPADDGAALSPPTNVVATIGSASTAGNMSSPRGSALTVLLQNGTVLLAGGVDATGSNISTSADIFTPSTGTFAQTGYMNEARLGASACLLGNGKVLITGGTDGGGNQSTTAELYDPSTGLFTLLPVTMNNPHAFHTSTLLQTGLVLIAGGMGAVFNTGTNKAELYDPTAGTFTNITGNLASTHFSHTATLLNNGKVLIAGGRTSTANGTTAAELYDPVANTSTATGAMGTARAYHAATLLTNGNVLITGGGTNTSTPVNTAEIYNTLAGTFSATAGNMLHTRMNHTAVRLPSGLVLIAGDGANGTTADLYNFSTGTFAATGAMPYGMSGGFITATSATAVLISTTSVLIAGGGSTPAATAMTYNITAGTFTTNGNQTQGTVYYKVAAQTATGYITVGGITTAVSPGTTLPSIEASVSGVPAATAVNVSWTPNTSSLVTGYAVYRGSASNAEQLLVVVGPTVTSYTDLGIITPSGALPTANTTGQIGTLDARSITWVGASSGDNTWRELVHGIDPLQYNATWTGPPQRYEIRQAIELWPAPADTTWLLRVKGYFAPTVFEADTDTASIDWQAIYFKSLADALRIYKREDEAKVEDQKLIDYVKRLVAGTHKTARYIPGGEKIGRTPPRPVIV
jgi:hypothetical protein